MPKKTMQKGGGEHRGLINTICFKGLALATPTYSPSTRLPPIPHVPTQMALVLLTQASLGNSGEQKREVSTLLRSEERRVGKECNLSCRSRWSPYH